MNKIIQQNIDGVSFNLKVEEEFSFLNRFGEVFCVFDQNDSGNINFGVKKQNGEKLFIKVAGAQTMNSFRTPEETVNALKQSIKIYEDLRDELLIDLVTYGSHGKLFFLVFRWATGECLFDHWNFEYYRENPQILSPREKFKQLRLDKKTKVANQILTFMEHVERKGYVAVDFYDGSLMYNFETDELTICDIDFFQKRPVMNNIGEDYWGTKHMKAPEEYQLHASIDSRTNVFTIGALFFHIFSTYDRETIRKIYTDKQFIQTSIEGWELTSNLYNIALKAVQFSPEDRYQTVHEFKETWLASLN
jgi:serine/threonine protein kinase